MYLEQSASISQKYSEDWAIQKSGQILDKAEHPKVLELNC